MLRHFVGGPDAAKFVVSQSPNGELGWRYMSLYPRPVRSWWSTYWRAVMGVFLTLVAIGIVFILAFLTGADKPPSRSTNLSLAILTALFQFGAAWMFQGVGKAAPSLVETSARRLTRLTVQAEQAEAWAQAALEKDDPKANQSELRTVLGQVSVSLSYLGEGTLDAANDWRHLHDGSVERAMRTLKNPLNGGTEFNDQQPE